MPALKHTQPRLSFARLLSQARSIVKDRVWPKLVPSRSRPARGPRLEVISAGPRWGYQGAPLVFVHGAFGAAWMWDEHFLSYFARAGRRVYALSLRGHGRSGGHAHLATTSFADYVDDVKHFLARLGAPPVLVGHSLGGLIVQRLIGHVPLRGIVLMASAPPEGILFVGNSFVGPAALFDHLHRSIPGGTRPRTDNWRRLLFSDKLAARRVTHFAARMGPESPRALSEAQIPGVIVSAWREKIPALVIAADRDRIIDHAMSRRTTHYHGATFRKVEPSGHAVMLDVSWQQAAKLIRQWLDENGL